MDLDPVFLFRLQFTWLVAFHILLPAFTVGIATYIAVMEGMYFATDRHIVPAAHGAALHRMVVLGVFRGKVRADMGYH